MTALMTGLSCDNAEHMCTKGLLMQVLAVHLHLLLSPSQVLMSLLYSALLLPPSDPIPDYVFAVHARVCKCLFVPNTLYCLGWI